MKAVLQEKEKEEQICERPNIPLSQKAENTSMAKNTVKRLLKEMYAYNLLISGIEEGYPVQGFDPQLIPRVHWW